MSSNITPSGPYVRDYEDGMGGGGHPWRLKNRSDARRVHRQWVRRTESETSYHGNKAYTPQCGDSVVYIPRAHYETLKEFPSFSPPWQNWPSGTDWPIVRCFVRGVRYRFPYEVYFRTTIGLCKSIVAILTLEVTGLPELSEYREFSWPKPSFVEAARPFVFELPVFESGSCEYLIPETLYTSRLKALEDNIRARNMEPHGLQVDIFYDNGQREDAEMDPWEGIIDCLAEDENEPQSAHLQGSGFGVLVVKEEGGVGGDFVDTVSPWEIFSQGATLPKQSLNEEETKQISDALKAVSEKNEVANHFNFPVDEVRYSDYGMMVEVPMDLLTVKRRLNEGYYGSKLSVVADLRLIRDNCIKYNMLDNEISQIAIDMCKDFEEKVLTPEESSQLISEEEFNKIQKEQSEGRQGAPLRIRVSARAIQQANEAAAASGATYSLRDRSRTARQRSSSLENLPPPQAAVAPRRGPRREASRASTAASHTRYNLRGQEGNSISDILGQVASATSRRNQVSGAGLPDQNRRSGRSTRQSTRNSDNEGDVHLDSSRATRRSLRNATSGGESPEQNGEDGVSNLRPSRTSRRSNRNSPC